MDLRGPFGYSRAILSARSFQHRRGYRVRPVHATIFFFKLSPLLRFEHPTMTGGHTTPVLLLLLLLPWPLEKPSSY
jgi:hypothetical protein